jgi:xylulokinase
LEAYAAAAPAGAEGLVFIPYLHGERAPIWDPSVAGAFLGLRERHDFRHFSRAVFEAAGFAVRHVLEACEETCGQRAGRIIVCGGGARSRFWNEIKAAILQRSVSPLQAQASACLGAAMLAAVGAGFYPDLPQAWRAMRRIAEDVLPDLELVELYNQRYREYRRAYPALKLMMVEEGRGKA